MSNPFEVEESLFTEESINDTLDIEDILVEDEEEMLARYHFYNTLYLYGVFEKAYAHEILDSRHIHAPITLYETPQTAIKFTNNNFKEKSVLRFAVRIGISISKNVYGYDGLIVENESNIKASKLSVDDYKKKCGYIREYDNKNKIIVYQIFNEKIIENCQVI